MKSQRTHGTAGTAGRRALIAPLPCGSARGRGAMSLNLALIDSPGVCPLHPHPPAPSPVAQNATGEGEVTPQRKPVECLTIQRAPLLLLALFANGRRGWGMRVSAPHNENRGRGDEGATLNSMTLGRGWRPLLLWLLIATSVSA